MAIITDPTTGQLVDTDTGLPVENIEGAAAPSYAPSATGAPAPTPALDQMAAQPEVQRDEFGTATIPNGPVAPQGPGSQSQSYSVGGGTNQFEQGVYNQQAPIRNKRDAEEARATSEVQGIMGAQAARYTDAANDQASAQNRIAEVESLKLDAQRSALESRGRLEQRMMVAEQAANEITAAEVQGHRAKFEQSVAAVKAASVDPTLNFTPPELAMVGTAIFAQYFLGAQGIAAPNVQGTIERWTDRYVDNQMEKIQRGERLLDSERAIWDMVRTDAADETDARGRLRALTLAQAATQFEVEGARWGSELAKAQGASAIASIKSAYASQMAELEGQWYDRLLSQKQFIQQKHYQDVSNAIASRHAKVAESAEARALRAEEAAKNAQPDVPRIVFSYENGPNGERTPIGVPRPGVSDVEMAKAMERYGSGKEILSTVEKLRTTLLNNGETAFTAEWAKRFQSEDDAVTKAVYAQLISAMRGAGRQTMGAAWTVNEEKLLKDQAYLSTQFTRLGRDGVLRLLDNLGEQQLTNVDSSLDQVLQDPTSDGSYKAWSGSVAPNLKSQYTAGINKRPPMPTDIEAAEAGVLQTQDNPQYKSTAFGERIGASGPTINRGVLTESAQENWAEPLRVLTDKALNGNEEERAKARKSIERIKNQSADSGATKRYTAASTVLNMLDTNPQTLQTWARPSDLHPVD